MQEEQPLLVIYDIEDAKLHRNMRRICRDFGLRHVQYSVAAGRITKRRRHMLEDRIERMLSEKVNGRESLRRHIIVMPLHNETVRKMRVFGEPLSIFQEPAALVLLEDDDPIELGDLRGE